MSDNSEPRRIIVTWEEYFELFRKLIRDINASGFKLRQVVCIARGGLLPGEIISRTLGDLPLAVVCARSYGETETEPGQFVFGRHLASAEGILPVDTLIVDELDQSGRTLKLTIEWFRRRYKIPRDKIRTAVVWHKKCSLFVPNFYGQLIVPDVDTGKYPWIDTPQELFYKTL